MDFRPDWYTKELILDGSGIQKDRFQMGVVFERIDFWRDWYTKGRTLDGSGIQKARFYTRMVYKMMASRRE